MYLDRAPHYNINPVTAEKINRAKVEGRRVIAVGTTSARTVESAAVYNEISVKYEVAGKC